MIRIFAFWAIVIAVSGCRRESDHDSSESWGTDPVYAMVFPRQYYQPYRHNYISDDQRMIVIGPDLSRIRKVDGRSCRPVSIVTKVGERFDDVVTVWCEMVDSGSSGNYLVRSLDGMTELDDSSFCYSDELKAIPIELTVNKGTPDEKIVHLNRVVLKK